MANGAESEDDRPLAEVLGLSEHSPPAPKHRVMLYRPSKIGRRLPVVAIRQLQAPKSQIGQARVIDGLSVERAIEVGQKFVGYLAEGAVEEAEVAELLADSFHLVGQRPVTVGSLHINETMGNPAI